MKLWLSHPTGNTFVRALLSQGARLDCDWEFFTTLGFSGANAWAKQLPSFIRAEIHRRTYDIAPQRLHASPSREVGRLIYQRLVGTSPPPGNSFSVDAIYASLDRNVGAKLRATSKRPNAVYAYEDGALETFRAAAASGVRRVYDLPIAYWQTVRRLLDEEAERYPAWEPTLLSTRDSREKTDRKTEELANAECVVCPSEFVRDSLPPETRFRKQCVVSVFGSPDVSMFSRAKPASKLRVLFAGSLTQRKGLADLFAAMRIVKRSDIELRVVGAPLLPLDFYRRQYPGLVYKKPRNHEAMLALMHDSDVLVLPSIVEGRALVQQEALACGLPLIITRNAGGEDLIEEGRTGFLVPLRSPEAIAEKIDWFAAHRDSLEDLRPECRRKASEYSWSAYASRIIEAIKDPEKLEPNTASSALACEIH